MNGRELLPKTLQRLIAQLAKLPSVGNKSAERLAYHLADSPELAASLSASLQESSEKITRCKKCFFVADEEVCILCLDPKRTEQTLCVVEKSNDILAIEQAGVYRGQYHVLNALWAPLRGQGPEQMNLDTLYARITELEISEVIVATGSTVEGEATALYLAKQLSDRNVKATRLAQGLPKGGELEYLDDVTLSRALAGRTEF